VSAARTETAAARKPPEELATGIAELRALRFRPAQREPGPLVVTFASGGTRVRRDERVENFATLRNAGRPCLYLVDRAFSFYSIAGMADRIERLVRDEMSELGAETTVTYGNSLGGFGAIAFATRFPVSVAYAQGPRYSPLHAIVPDRRRYPYDTGELTQFPFRTLDEGLAAAGQVVLVHGLNGPDRVHARRIPRRPNVDHFVMPRVDHNVGSVLKEAGRLDEVLAGLFRGDVEAMRRALRSAGAIPARSLRGRVELSLAGGRLRRLRPTLQRWRGLDRRDQARGPEEAQ
jgi:pimeloyl-ACP methyl ester carboxylesterase